ncbi:hypothetical protein, partial [Ornithobacterium rhinotracheale]
MIYIPICYSYLNASFCVLIPHLSHKGIKSLQSLFISAFAGFFFQPTFFLDEKSCKKIKSKRNGLLRT